MTQYRFNFFRVYSQRPMIPKIWYHGVMKKCVLAGFDASTEIHQQQIQKLVAALEFAALPMHFQVLDKESAERRLLIQEKAQQALNDFKKWSGE